MNCHRWHCYDAWAASILGSVAIGYVLGRIAKSWVLQTAMLLGFAILSEIGVRVVTRWRASTNRTRWLRKNRIWIAIAATVLPGFLAVVIGFVHWILHSAHSHAFFAFGQVYADTVVLPTTLVLFVYEMKQRSHRPDLDVQWGTGVGVLHRDNVALVPKAPQTGFANTVRPVIFNRGDAIARWYRVRLWIPEDLVAGIEADKCWYPVVGGFPPVNPAEMVRLGTRQGLLLTFPSEGQEAIFPLDQLILGDLTVYLRSDKDYEKEYSLRYTVHTDWGQKREGALTLRIVKQGARHGYKANREQDETSSDLRQNQ